MFEIKPAGRFVKHNDLPVTHNGRRNRYSLFLSTGKRKRVPVFVCQQIKLLKDFIHNSLILIVHAQKDFICHTFCKELMAGILHYHIAVLEPSFPIKGFSVNLQNSTFLFQSANAAGQSRFPRTVQTDNGNRISF